MKHSVLWMGAVFLLLFGLVALFRVRGGDDAADEVRSDAETIRSFWETYNAATESRLAGNYEAAAEAYRQALAIDPKHQDSHFYLATSLESSGHYAEAASVLQKLTSLYPEHSRAWSQLGMVLASKAPGASHDLDGAEAAFRRAQEINSEHTGPFLRRGLLALERGDVASARELFAIASDAGSPEGTFLSGLAAHLDEDPEAASRFFQRVLEKSAREAEITGRGASAEGDVEGELTALDRATIRAKWFLEPKSAPRADFVRVDDAHIEGRGAFVDLDRNGEPSLVIASDRGLFVDSERVYAGKCWDVVPFDFDGDRWTDLYVIGSGYNGTASNVLLRNDNGALVDVTAKWALAGERSTSDAVAADLDGDANPDVLEVGSPPLRLFLQREGRFEHADRGLTYDAHGVDAALADVDADGRLDIFVLGWKAPARLFRNTGDAFEDITHAAGLGAVGGDGFSALFVDVDVDGDSDLLVTAHAPVELSLARSSNGPTPRLYQNDGRGRFVDVTAEVGLDRAFGILQAVASDFDGDGFPDLAFALGGLDAAHLEPSIVLRNVEGNEFVEWTLLPSPGEPHRALGVAASGSELYLSGSGLFRSVHR